MILAAELQGGPADAGVDFSRPLQAMRRIWLAQLLHYSAAAEAAWSCAADSYYKSTDVLLDVGILFEKSGLNSNCGVFC
jgi:hypothetical protein